MSTNCCWSPLQEAGSTFPKAIKFLMQQKFGAGYGTETLTRSDVPYFEGARDAGCSKAQEVIDAIEESGAIKIYEE